MRLPRQLVRGQMIAFVVGHGSGLMGVSGLVVKFRDGVVWARHSVVLRSLDAPSRPAEPLDLPAHPSAIDGKDGPGDVVAGR
jgi:hypothetical protein